MKKIVTLLLTVIMIAANASAVFAADCNYSLGADTGSADLSALKPGDVIKFVAKLDSNSGLAYVKNTITFDSDVFERVDYEKENEDGDIETYAVYSSWGSFTVNDAQAGKTIFNWANATNKTGKTVFKIWYKVKENVDNGSYDFDLVCNEAKNADKAAIDIGASKCTVTVTGGKEPAGEDKADVATYAVDSKIAPSGSVTFGISGEVKVTGTASFNRITFNLKDGKKPGKYDWDIVDAEGNPVSISAPSTTFGLNIKGCPVGANITVDSIKASLVSAE